MKLKNLRLVIAVEASKDNKRVEVSILLEEINIIE